MGHCDLDQGSFRALERWGFSRVVSILKRDQERRN